MPSGNFFAPRCNYEWGFSPRLCGANCAPPTIIERCSSKSAEEPGPWYACQRAVHGPHPLLNLPENQSGMENRTLRAFTQGLGVTRLSKVLLILLPKVLLILLPNGISVSARI